MDARTILLLEDDPDDQVLTARALEKGMLAGNLVVAGLYWIGLNAPPPKEAPL